MIGSCASRKVAASVCNTDRISEVPEISKGWPARKSCCTSTVTSAIDLKSGQVYSKFASPGIRVYLQRPCPDVNEDRLNSATRLSDSVRILAVPCTPGTNPRL